MCFFLLGYIIMLYSVPLSYMCGFKNKTTQTKNFDKTVNAQNYEVMRGALLASGEWGYAMYFLLYLLNTVNTGTRIFCCYSHK